MIKGNLVWEPLRTKKDEAERKWLKHENDTRQLRQKIAWINSNRDRNETQILSVPPSFSVVIKGKKGGTEDN